MKKIALILSTLTLSLSVSSQEKLVDYEEFTLDNGLHVILHEDNTTPIVAVSVLYHVGSKNENPDRTGFAHFFEHLLFEGSENIARGEYDQYVERNGGTLNANTSQDRTFYYELFSSNNLELGLWLESERMLHAKVDEKGVETQRAVVKEERKQRMDNQPYGTFMEESFSRLFSEHPYRWSVIGSMEHLDAATEEDYINFYKTFYVPANATLSIAGDIDVEEAKKLVGKYFGTIPKGQAINLYRDYLKMPPSDFEATYGVSKSVFNEDDFFATTNKEGKAVIEKYKKKPTEIPRPDIKEQRLDREIKEVIEDDVQLPGIFVSYLAPPQNSDDALALEMLNQILSGSSSSRMNKSIVEKKELAQFAFSFNFPLEDPGMLLVAAFASAESDPDDVLNAIDEEIEKVKTELVTDEEFERTKNQLENQFYSTNASVAGIAESLANYHVYFGDADIINKRLSLYDKVTKEDLKRVANEYFTQDSRVVLYYMPKSE